jgi:hypothetical protein
MKQEGIQIPRYRAIIENKIYNRGFNGSEEILSLERFRDPTRKEVLNYIINCAKNESATGGLFDGLPLNFKDYFASNGDRFIAGVEERDEMDTISEEIQLMGGEDYFHASSYVLSRDVYDELVGFVKSNVDSSLLASNKIMKELGKRCCRLVFKLDSGELPEQDNLVHLLNNGVVLSDTFSIQTNDLTYPEVTTCIHGLYVGLTSPNKLDLVTDISEMVLKSHSRDTIEKILKQSMASSIDGNLEELLKNDPVVAVLWKKIMEGGENDDSDDEIGGGRFGPGFSAN